MDIVGVTFTIVILWALMVPVVVIGPILALDRWKRRHESKASKAAEPQQPVLYMRRWGLLRKRWEADEKTQWDEAFRWHDRRK